MNKELFGSFPREFGKRRMYISDKNKMRKVLEKYNHKINCFVSVYSPNYKKGDKRNYNDMVIDQLFFDIDMKVDKEAERKCGILHVARCLEQFLYGENFRHCMIMSGQSFHIYMKTKPQRFVDARHAIRNAQVYIAKSCGLTIGESGIADIDFSLIGRVSGIGRLLNTWNPKRKRYCIAITREELQCLSLDAIYKLAESPRKGKLPFEGKKLINLEDYDFDDGLSAGTSVETLDVDVSNIEDEEMKCYMLMLPPFIRGLLLNKKDHHNDMYVTTLACAKAGLPKAICKSLAIKYWSLSSYNHWLLEESDQFSYLYNRYDDGTLYFPFWSTLMKEMNYNITQEDLKFEW